MMGAPIERRMRVAPLGQAILGDGRVPHDLGGRAFGETGTRGDEEALERDQTRDERRDHARAKTPSSFVTPPPHKGKLRVKLRHDQAVLWRDGGSAVSRAPVRPHTNISPHTG
jgi:hypothetical protein